MDAERWMLLHPEIDMIAAINKIKDYFKDNLYQIILSPDKYTTLEIILHEHRDNAYSDLFDDFLFNKDITLYFTDKENFNALIPFGDLFNLVALEGIVFYGPELKRPCYDLRELPVDASYAENHNSTYRIVMAFNVGWILTFSCEAYNITPLEITEKWLSSETAYDVYRFGYFFDEKYNYFTSWREVFRDWNKELTLEWVGPESNDATIDNNPMFWLGYILQHLIYKDGLPPVTLLKKYNIRRIIADIEMLRTLCTNDAVDILSEKYALEN